MWQAVSSNPAAWATAVTIILGVPLGGLWKQFNGLRDKVAECEKDKAVLSHEVTELRGAVKTLTTLLKKEIHIA